jgi:hypothetical protein
MSNQAEHGIAAPAEGIIARWRTWWRQNQELANLPRDELQRLASDFGMASRDLEDLVAKGPHAADLLHERLAALGLTRSDVERIASGLVRDLERTCACCGDKTECRKDLAAQPDDPAWKEYCPNATSLEAIMRSKGRALV